MNIFVLHLSSVCLKTERFLDYTHFFPNEYQMTVAYVTEEKLRKIEEKTNKRKRFTE